MWSTRIGTALLGLIGLGIAYIGITFLVDPLGSAAGFAGSTIPDPAQVAGNAKGVRDLVSGIAVAVLLVSRQRRVAGWFAIGAALIPIGDMLVVLSQGGSVVIALAVHGATALAAVLAGVLLLRGTAPAPAAAPVRAAAHPVAS
jgi:Domain of unknown function (DUF4267)